MHTRRSLTENTIPNAVLIQYTRYYTVRCAHQTVTYKEYYTKCCTDTIYQTLYRPLCTPDGHLQRILYQMLCSYNIPDTIPSAVHTGRSLTENTIPNAVLIQYTRHYTVHCAHRTVTYREYYTKCCTDTIYQTLYRALCTPDCHLQRILYQMLY